MDVDRYVKRKVEYNRSYMPEYHKRRKEIMKAQNRCTDCGAKDEYTLAGRSKCKVCCEKGKAYRRGERAERKPPMSPEELEEHIRAYHREYQREYRAWRKEHHICTECGRQDALTINGHAKCQACKEKAHGRPYVPKVVKAIDRDYLPVEPKMTMDERRDRIAQGKCYLCGAPVKEGTPSWDRERHKLCEKHYDMLVEAGKKGRDCYEKKHGKTYGQETYDWINAPKAGKVKRTG